MHYQSRKYHRLVEWIALHDNPASNDSVEELAGYLTVTMVADCYDLKKRDVAEDVYRVREHLSGSRYWYDALR